MVRVGRPKMWSEQISSSILLMQPPTRKTLSTLTLWSTFYNTASMASSWTECWALYYDPSVNNRTLPWDAVKKELMRDRWLEHHLQRRVEPLTKSNVCFILYLMIKMQNNGTLVHSGFGGNSQAPYNVNGIELSVRRQAAWAFQILLFLLF